MKHTIAKILMAGTAAGSVLFAGTASAIDWNITGFVRQEIAYGIASNENPITMGVTRLTTGLHHKLRMPTSAMDLMRRRARHRL